MLADDALGIAAYVCATVAEDTGVTFKTLPCGIADVERMSLDNLHRDKVCFLVFAELQLALLYAHALLLGLWRCALFIVEQIGGVVGSVAVVLLTATSELAVLTGIAESTELGVISDFIISSDLGVIQSVDVLPVLGVDLAVEGEVVD